MFQVMFQGDLFADYFQVYLHDADHPELPDDYTAESIARRLMAGPFGLILHTARNMTVPVCVEWHAERPEPELEAFQHVAEAGVACPTGRLVLAGLTDDVATAPRLAVRPGPIAVRASFAGLDTLDDSGLEGDDRYLVQLWPAQMPEGVAVLKLWPGA
ncbi:hypothetical protein GGR33_002628 [Methylobacterium brachythecii]|nr:hypothetical protein [Methylobacterium brachythecii]MBB3903126.1 hypothetical protein [Methylobacterium brachythecii]